jgi:hypothetical protein
MIEKFNLLTAIISVKSMNKLAAGLVEKQRCARQYFYESKNEKATKCKILLSSGLLTVSKE